MQGTKIATFRLSNVANWYFMNSEWNMSSSEASSKLSLIYRMSIGHMDEHAIHMFLP